MELLEDVHLSHVEQRQDEHGRRLGMLGVRRVDSVVGPVEHALPAHCHESAGEAVSAHILLRMGGGAQYKGSKERRHALYGTAQLILC